MSNQEKAQAERINGNAIFTYEPYARAYVVHRKGQPPAYVTTNHPRRAELEANRDNVDYLNRFMDLEREADAAAEAEAGE